MKLQFSLRNIRFDSLVTLDNYFLFLSSLPLLLSQYFKKLVCICFGRCLRVWQKDCRNVLRFPSKALDRPPSVPASGTRSKKEVFQPHLPVRLPCYDLAPIICFALGRSFRSRTSGAPNFHGLTGGVYKARERIHRAIADARLLANPASRSRVADSDPN